MRLRGGDTEGEGEFRVAGARGPVSGGKQPASPDPFSGRKGRTPAGMQARCQRAPGQGWVTQGEAAGKLSGHVGRAWFGILSISLEFSKTL